MNTKIPLFKEINDVFSILNFLPDSQEVVECFVNPFLNSLLSKISDYQYRINLLYDYFLPRISKSTNFLDVQENIIIFFNVLFMPDLKDEEAIKNFPTQRVGNYFYNNFQRFVGEIFGNPNIENFAFQVLKSCGGNFVARCLKKYLRHLCEKLEAYLNSHRTILRIVFPGELKEENDLQNTESKNLALKKILLKT